MDFDAAILYTPISKEVDYNSPSFPFPIPEKRIYLPKEKMSDPFEWADKCIERFKNEKVCILIPGTMFDTYGTRHGKGIGWYDRFLSKVPRTWTRIGITDRDHFTQDKLERKEWDEPMNIVLVLDNRTWNQIAVTKP